MPLNTCFLPHFPRTLQGRAKRTEASRLASSLHELRQLALPDLSALLDAFLPASFFSKAPGAKAKRVRLLPPVTVFWAFLYQVLNPDMACQEVVSKLRCWRLSQRKEKTANTCKPALGTSGYCQARAGLQLHPCPDSGERQRPSAGTRTHQLQRRCGSIAPVVAASRAHP